ncbi:hypothetical protein ScPMuIL_007320 [Solemya velum]
MDTVQTKPATKPLAKPVTSVAGNLGLKRKLEEQTSKTKDVKKRQKSTTTTEGGPSGGGEEAPSCSWQGDTSHVQPGGTQLKSLRAKPDEVEDEATPATTIVISPDGVMRGACNVIENVQTGGNIVAAPVKLNIYADQMMIGDGNILQTEKLDEICESLVNIVDIPANNTTQNKVLISLIEPFIDSLRKFSLRLKKDNADHREKYHRRTEVPRIPEQDCSSEIGVGVGKVEDRYKAFGPNGLGSRSL